MQSLGDIDFDHMVDLVGNSKYYITTSIQVTITKPDWNTYGNKNGILAICH